VLLLLSELVEFLKKSAELYADIAEGNGQDGDFDLYEQMMEEHKIVCDFCKKLEETYVQHQTLHNIQFHTLLCDEGESVYKAVGNVMEVYGRELEYEMEKLKEKQNKVKGVQGVIEAINP